LRRVPPRRRGRAVVDAGVMRMPGLIPVVVASITSIGLHDAEEGSAPDAAAGSLGPTSPLPVLLQPGSGKKPLGPPRAPRGAGRGAHLVVLVGPRSGLCGLATAFRAGGRAGPAAEPH
jgi:hypothetical protein